MNEKIEHLFILLLILLPQVIVIIDPYNNSIPGSENDQIIIYDYSEDNSKPFEIEETLGDGYIEEASQNQSSQALSFDFEIDRRNYEW